MLRFILVMLMFQTAVGPRQASGGAANHDTPHRLLWTRQPDAALAIMKLDPGWVIRRDDDQRTPLHIAARFAHIEVVEWLLDHGADVDAIAYNGFTPLHLTSDPRVVALILTRDPNLTNRSNGQTPLQRAADTLTRAHDMQEETKWQEIVDLYLEHGAEYDIVTAIHLDDFGRVRTILEESPEHAHGYQRKTPLRVAASLGRLDICRYLIERHDVDVDDFEGGVGYPVIKSALAYPAIVRLLIESGADLDTRITWRGGRSGIWIIGDEATSLHFAARDGVPETIVLLLDHGLDPLAYTHDPFEAENTQTALEVAAFFGQTENAVAIMNHPSFDRADNAIRQLSLDTALRTSASPSWPEHKDVRVELMDALLRRGADANAGGSEPTPIQIAARQIDPNDDGLNKRIRRMIDLLIQHGGTLDLFSAVASGHEAGVERLLEEVPESVDAREHEGYPALHFAVAMNYAHIVELLVAAGCNVDIRSTSTYPDGRGTALHAAAFWERYEIARMLIEAGATVDARSERDSTPLHSAARSGSVRMVQLLLEHGADAGARDNKGEAPLDWCRRGDQDGAADVERLLEEYGGKFDK